MEQPSTVTVDMSEEREWLSQDELVSRWRISKKTIRRLRQAGKLPALEITPALFRFRMTDILRIESEGKFLPAIAPRRSGKVTKPKR